jgi:hypothetical protein
MEFLKFSCPVFGKVIANVPIVLPYIMGFFQPIPVILVVLIRCYTIKVNESYENDTIVINKK